MMRFRAALRLIPIAFVASSARPAPSAAEMARDLSMIRGWERELASIPLESASLADVDDAKLLRAQLVGLERQYLIYKTYEKDPSGPALAILGAIFTQFLHLPIIGTQGASQADVDSAWKRSE